MPPQPKPRPVADPDQIAALTRELARQAGGDPATLRFGVALSGGPDSVALLLLMNALKLGGLEAATVDHRLRAESADEAEAAAQLCQKFNVPHQILRSDTAVSGSLQANARKLRYTLLEDWRAERGIDFIVTAHHADDQAETLLMRLNRASGVAGLSAIRARNVQVLRPVLAWRRHDLAAVVANAGVKAADDPSNRNPHFDRVRMRQQLGQAPWLDAPALARSATLLAEADAALDWAASQIITNWPASVGRAQIVDGSWPDELGWRIVRDRLLGFGANSTVQQRQLIDAIAALRSGQKVSLGAVTITPDRKEPALWRIATAPPRRG